MNNARVTSSNKASRILAAGASLLAIVACGADDAAVGSTASGGAPVTVGSGGSSTGGTTATTGGSSAGGTTATTGGSSAGGTTATTGGSSAGGTTPTTGGSSAGGTTPTTGGTASGGTAATTGGTSAGGTTATTGGTSAGGTAATTGGTSAGGTSAGGTSAGGANTGQGGAPVVINPDDIKEPKSELIGWASTSACGIDGVSGGGDQELVQVAGDDLQGAVMDDEPRVVLFSGETTGPVQLVGNNKTIIGIDGGHIKGGLSISGGKKNTIIRNMKFSCGGGDCDAIEVSGASCIWFDHIEAFDGGDGNMDIVRGSDLITVSWSKFYYDKRNHDHRLSNLNGNKAGDTPGKIRVTFHHNWWGDKVLQRMPRVRHGRVHVFNNYYSTKVAQYFFGLSDSAKLVVENNFAEHPPSEHPIKFFNTSGTEISMSGNKLASFGNADDRATGAMPWNPKGEYNYELESPEYAKAVVMKYAGVDK